MTTRFSYKNKSEIRIHEKLDNGLVASVYFTKKRKLKIKRLYLQYLLFSINNNR